MTAGAAPRTVLYTPGDRPDRLAKAWEDSEADLVLADLEDAVMPAHKDQARRAVAELLARMAPRGMALDLAAGTSPGPMRGVRINAWPSEAARADLAAVLPGRPAVVAVPKAEDPASVRELDAELARLEALQGIPAGSTRLLLILETARGVLLAREVAAASRRTLALAFGAEDLAADAGMLRSAGNAEVAVARGLVVLGAAAARVAAIDMITAAAKDLERTAREAAEARAMGFAGKMCIHPLQVKAIHEAFRPTPGEVDWARRVVAAVDEAGIGDGGVVVVDGKMVDVPFIRQARRILGSAR